MRDIKYINSKTKEAYNTGAQKYHNLFHNEMNEKEYDRKLLDKFSALFAKGATICDAGCGPSAHIGKYLFDKGHVIYGIDISEKCIELALNYNPEIIYQCGDIGAMPYKNNFFDGIISYYSIIDTPKDSIGIIFREFNRVLKPGGFLLTAVKEGTSEGFIDNFLGFRTEIYFSLFCEKEIREYYNKSGFIMEFLEKRNPYDFEINNDRIFAIGRKRF